MAENEILRYKEWLDVMTSEDGEFVYLDFEKKEEMYKRYVERNVNKGRHERTVLANRTGEWTEISFSELSKGDNFRMFESTGEEVVGKNNEVIFYSTSEPYKNEHGIWQIDIKD
jgi:hypothetical protein